MAIPEADLFRLRRWAEQRVPKELWPELKVEADVEPRHVTIVEVRPPWDGRGEHTRFPIARLRHTAATGLWSLYWRDRNLKFHEYDRKRPNSRRGPWLSAAFHAEKVDRSPVCLTRAVPSDDPAQLINRLVSSMSLQEQRELVATLLDQRTATWLSDLRAPRTPTLLRKPRTVRGFQVRLDLRSARPPVWRRLVLPGDMTLSELHSVIQGAMGWYDSHLHRFRTGADHNAAYFITEFDLDEGEEGIIEDQVRLDRVIADVGDGLWYEYDFGDGWDHVLKVEKVLLQPPSEVQLLTGKRACPPEDVGGIGGYAAVAEWVESGYDDALLPEQFDDAHHARDWLPVDWHPAEFDVEQARADINRRA